MAIQNPHTEATQKALTLLKELSSNLDGWKFTSEKDGVKLYNKTDSSPFPIVRGDVVLAGTEFTVREVATVASSPGCRKYWDDKFDVAELKQMYNINEALFWSKVKTPWPITPRDLSAISIREISDEDVCYTVMASVQDASIPDVSGCVRSHLFVSGWKIYKVDAGIVLSYITQVDLAGSIPTSFLKNIQQQLPLCAGLVVKYIKKHGFPPVVYDFTADVKSESFDHDKKEYNIELFGTGGGKWVISKKMFPAGVKVNVTGKASHEFVNDTVVITGVDGPTTIKISKA